MSTAASLDGWGSNLDRRAGMEHAYSNMYVERGWVTLGGVLLVVDRGPCERLQALGLGKRGCCSSHQSVSPQHAWQSPSRLCSNL